MNELKISSQTALKISLLFCITVSFFMALYFTRALVLAALVGLGMACLFSPLLTFLKTRLRFPRALGILVILIVLGLLFVASGYLITLFVQDQISSFSEKLPQIVEKLRVHIQDWKESFPVLENVSSDLSNFSWKDSVLPRLLQGFKGGLAAVTGIILSIAISIYVAVRSKSYLESWVGFFPNRHRDTVEKITLESAQTIRAWFVAQLIDMAIVGLCTAAGLWIVGIEYWAVFGLLIGVFAVIPYIGVLTILLLSLLIVSVEQPDKIWALLIVNLVVQQLEGNVILPLVMRGQVQLPAAPLIFFMVVMGVWFGILGVFIAPGLFAVLRTIYVNLRTKEA